ncbi:unnamed protein product [Xylocopa violacea]|uniref:Uncharacterized protein n=1 Tax=Xylocopa violacea TaxID=135666 RepID=A0ABP1P298_XYLVO
MQFAPDDVERARSANGSIRAFELHCTSCCVSRYTETRVPQREQRHVTRTKNTCVTHERTALRCTLSVAPRTRSRKFANAQRSLPFTDERALGKLCSLRIEATVSRPRNTLIVENLTTPRLRSTYTRVSIIVSEIGTPVVDHCSRGPREKGSSNCKHFHISHIRSV